MVERAEETGKLQNDLNSLRREFNTLKGEYKKVSHRFSNFRKLCHAMARKEIVDADGEPILFGDILYGEDGRACDLQTIRQEIHITAVNQYLDPKWNFGHQQHGHPRWSAD